MENRIVKESFLMYQGERQLTPSEGTAALITARLAALAGHTPDSARPRHRPALPPKRVWNVPVQPDTSIERVVRMQEGQQEQ